MINEYYEECNNLKIFIDDEENTLKVEHVSTGEYEVFNITPEYVTEINDALASPGFQWGSVLMKVFRAVSKAIGGGSDAQ